MMLRLSLAFSLTIALLSSCDDPARPCRTDSQCEDGERCVVDEGADVGVCAAEGEGEGDASEGEGEGDVAEGEGEHGAVAASVIDVGGVFACAIDADRHVQCWGGNSRGQLGRATDSQRDDEAAAIANLDDVTDLAVGEFHACALGRRDGGQQRLWCWGDPADVGVEGNVEPGTLVEPLLPAGFGVEAKDVDADGANNGGLTCVTDGGRVFCFGPFATDFGSAGGTAVEVNGLGDDVAHLDVSLDGVCATAGNGDVTCVHTSNGLGLLGCVDDGACAALDNGAVYAVETSAACIVGAGSVSCAGDNEFGIVDPEHRGNGAQPLTALPLSGVVDVSVGEQHACAVVGASLKCWGRPIFGATGVLETDTFDTEPCDADPLVRCHGIRDVPVPAGIVGFAAVTTHRSHSCALSTDGRVVCWGNPSPADPESARPRQIEMFH